MYTTINAVREELLSGELARMEAIETLQDQFNYTSLDAEEMVDSWLEGD